MKAKRGFSKDVVVSIRDGKILGIRAGTKPHRVIGIWAVVVENRVSVRAVFTRSERLKTAVDRAYREKYNTPGSLHYVRGFAHKKRRDTTTELVPERARMKAKR
jgi:N-acetylglutamate synthase/N-acetylornithine aminotransferase